MRRECLLFYFSPYVKESLQELEKHCLIYYVKNVIRCFSIILNHKKRSEKW